MSDELKECPFCGVKLSIENWGDVDFDVTHEDEAEARRRECPLACCYDYSSMQSAVKAANMRYERTCTCEGSIFDEGLGEFVHDLSCGHTAYTHFQDLPNYCDECGARVVGD